VKKLGRVLASLTALLLVISSLSFASGPSESGSTSYLIGLRPGASARGLAIAGLQVKSEWAQLGAAHVVANSAAAARLNNHRMVTYIEEDRPVSIMGHDTLPYADGAYTWGLQAVHAAEAWALGSTGTGLKVCVIDTGIDYNHPAFVRDGLSIIKGSRNFHADGNPQPLTATVMVPTWLAPSPAKETVAVATLA
jgi:subtilisin family serine protease